MVNHSSFDYVPYKYAKIVDSNEVQIFARGIERDDRKVFTHQSSDWLVVDPHRYVGENEEDIRRMLAGQFQTSSVSFDDKSSRFIVRNSPVPIGHNAFNINESDFRSLIQLPDNYTTHIIMNGKRFYNNIDATGKWLNSRQAKSHQTHHYFATATEFCRAVDPQHAKSYKSFRHAVSNGDVDIVFANIDQDDFERIYGHLPIEVDYVQIPSASTTIRVKTINDITAWYVENIARLYKLSFISSRNLSDVWPQNKESSKRIAEDILLGLNLSLYSGNSILYDVTLPQSFGIRGKYSNVYFYKIGYVLRNLLQESADSLTNYVGKSLEGIEDFSDIISYIFMSTKLAPGDFTLPPHAFYFDRQILCSSAPILQDDYEITRENVDYVIVLGAQSMIKCVKSSNHSHYLNAGNDQDDHIIFTGLHHICTPLFPAALKAVRDYALGMMYNSLMDWEILVRFVDSHSSSFEIHLAITRANLDHYRYLLTPEEIETIIKKDEILSISTWLTSTDNHELTRTFDAVKTTVPSLNYIKRVLGTLDLIPVG